MSQFFFASILFLATITSTLPAYELSIATIFKDEGPYLQEWIEYHRMVGVEHFWLYNDASKDNWKEVLQPYISAGIVEVIDWPVPTYKHFIECQRNAFRDALKKSIGITKWLALIDIDEFLVPAKEKTVTECLKKHFPDAAGVYINWRHFGTGGITLKEGESLLFRLTACSNPYHPNNNVGKSIVRPECTRPDDLWNIHHYPLKPDTYYYNGDAKKLSFVGLDLKLDGKVHNKFIRLNHYTMRDEHFFHNTRLVRARGIGIEEWLVWEHYHAFNQEQDKTIINFIREKHPKMYEKFWEPRVLSHEHVNTQDQKPFVTARIYGQLGNNLFQVAVASALAWDNNAEPVFQDFSSNSALYQHVFFRFKNKLPKKPITFEWHEKISTYHTIPYHPNMLMIGYFQSEQYFAHYRARLLELFAPHPNDLTYIQKKYQHVLDHPNTVGVQIRYYKWEFPTETMFPQYGKDYLEKTMALFPQDSLFVVSSNNIDFARKNIPEWAKNVLFLEREENYIDLYVLSLCKHNIITNSTFGWWAAWLNQNPNKIIVRPATWTAYINGSDACPKEWLSVDAHYE